jgi:hypothetical protein
VSVRDYGWYLAAFLALVAAGACIGFAGVTLFASQRPMYISIAFSLAAIVLAIVAWRRYPKSDPE